MNALRRLLVVVAALSLPVAALAQAAPAASDWTFALHGFVSMSAAYQDGLYFPSEGQQSLTAGVQPTFDKNSLTFDVRQSRFNFSVKGPKVLGGATPTGVLEIDFFQGFGGGAYGDVSLLNRMRLAYSELNWGSTRLLFGQQNDLIFAMAPTSLSHIAFPLGYATGNLGWRRPGVFGYHTLGVSDDTKVEVAWEVGRAQWNDAAAAAGGGAVAAPANGITAGEASGGPAVEGRVTLTGGKLYNVWVAAHYNRADLNGVNGAGAVNGASSYVTSSFHAGAKLTLEGLTLAATGFSGKNTAPLIGDFLSFGAGAAANQDVKSTGYWAQAGFNFTKEFSLWAFYGNQKPNLADAKAAHLARFENTTMNAIAMYRDGGYGLSVEWINFKTKIANATFTDSTTNKANQYIASANYFF